MKVSSKWIRLCNIACGVLLLALLLCQFLPAWTMSPCTCTGGCEPAPNKLSEPKIDSSCKACTITYKLCKNLDAKYRAGIDPKKLLNTSEEWTVSLQQYVWTPTFEGCKGMTEYFSSIYSTDDYDFMLNDVKDMPVLVFFFSLLGAYFGFFKSKNPLSSIFALCTSIAAVVAYLTMPFFQSIMMWQVHLVLAILIGLIALVPTYEYVRRAINWLNPNKG